MRKGLALTLIILLLPLCAHAKLSGYGLEKSITLTGSETDSTSAGYVMEIPVCPYEDTVETGTWTVNSTSYTKRIAITLIERTGAAFSTDPVMIEIDTLMLATTRSLFHAGSVGDEVDFSEDASAGLYYYVVESEFNTARTRYFVQVDLTANQTKTIYMYFGPDVTAHSDMCSGVNTFATDYSDTYSVAASGDDVRWVNSPSASATNEVVNEVGGYTSASGYTYGGVRFEGDIRYEDASS